MVNVELLCSKLVQELHPVDVLHNGRVLRVSGNLIEVPRLQKQINWIGYHLGVVVECVQTLPASYLVVR